MNKESKGKNIQSVQRAIDIIKCFDVDNIELTLQEISHKLNLNKSTVHGIINTLHNNLFIQQNSNGKYMLGKALFDISVYSIQTNKMRLRTLSKPYTSKISNKYLCTTHVFAKTGNRIQFLDMTIPVNSHYVISIVLSNEKDLHCTASGKILLSRMNIQEREEYLKTRELVPYTPKTLISKSSLIENLEEILRNGYAVEDEEAEIGCVSIAVPILTKQEDLFGTLSISGTKIRISDKIDEIVSDLKIASDKISEQLF